ncbi:hypothetical protein, partial [Bacteroides sp.]|uniref:hypothetical protein n=1 Tax=Bacteroides sp. TaxID=29523 RepID=UPI00257EB8A7
LLQNSIINEKALLKRVSAVDDQFVAYSPHISNTDASLRLSFLMNTCWLRVLKMVSKATLDITILFYVFYIFF